MGLPLLPVAGLPSNIPGLPLNIAFDFDRRAVPRNAEKSAILSRSVLGISSSPGNDLGRF